jgi:ketosteroid isomerase-like protein
VAHARAQPHRWRSDWPRRGLRQFGRYGGETNGTFKADLQQVFGSDTGRVVAIHHNSAARNGKRLDTDCCIVFEVKNGQMVSGREHFYDLHNWDAFWA